MKIMEVTNKEDAIKFLDNCVESTKVSIEALADELKQSILEWKVEIKRSAGKSLNNEETDRLVGLYHLLDVAPKYYFDLLEKSTKIIIT